MYRYKCILLFLFFFVSCSEDDYDEVISEVDVDYCDENESSSRAVSTNFDPIEELKNNEIPILLYNSDMYLTTDQDCRSVFVNKKLDTPERQEWLCLFHPMAARYAVSPCLDLSKYLSRSGQDYLVIANGIPYPICFQPVSDGASSYYITTPLPIGIPPIGDLKYMQRKSISSNDLVYKDSKSSLGVWNVSPSGDCSIEQIEYVPFDGGSIEETEAVIETFSVDNSRSAVPLERTKTVEKTIEETSFFSETHGVTTTTSVSSSTKVGLPSINLDGSVSVSSSLSSSFAQNTTNRTTTKISETFKITVPAYTKYTLETVVTTRNIRVMYIAVLKNSKGKSFRVKGVWSGIQASKVAIKAISDQSENPITLVSKVY